ncbi:MAG: restriction endonuclease subunit S [Candidatus Binatia bacterium]
MSTDVGTRKRFKLDQLGFVGRGRSRHRPRNDPSLYGGLYPFFQTGDIKAANLYLYEHSQTYNGKGLAQSKLWEPGTLCITIAANIAETAILKIRGCFPDSVVGFVPDPEKADVRFVKYYIDFIKLRMQGVSHGTTQDNLSLDKLLTFDFLMPTLEVQHKIAAILSAYDELIENNLQRIQILEEMAQVLYREWFVNFRFPGYEKVRMVDSPLGKIPERWEVRPFVDLLESYLGGDWGSDTPNEKGNCPVVVIRGADLKNISRGAPSKTPTRYINQKSLAKRELRPGDVVVENSVNASSRCVGSSLLITDSILRMIGTYAICASFCKTFRPKNPVLSMLMHLHLQYLREENKMPFYQNVATNGIANFQAKRFVDTECLVLPKERPVLSNMLSMLSDLTDLASVLAERNANLRRTRDLLLPRLISGELDVSNLNIDIGEEAA